MPSRLKTFALKINKHLYPEEIFVILFFFLFGIFFLLQNWQIIFWDKTLTFTTINRIMFPMVVFFVLTLFKEAFLPGKIHKKIVGLAFNAARIWLLLYMALIVHMNLKIKVPFINPNLFDEFYYNFDLTFSFLLSPIFYFRDWVQQYIDLGPLYTWGYETLFLVTFVLLYLTNKKAFRRMFFATILILLVGGVSYSFFPAIGPFYYSPSHSLYSKEVQEIMLQKYELYKNSGGALYSPAYLIQGIAAMPSLHTANTFAFLYFIFRYLRRYSLIYIPVFLYIIIDAIYTKYHYSLDIVFGIILAAICIYFAEVIYAKRERHLDKSPVLV
ncbi:MAG: phosphatase PAP2 family protein [Patescibacteria group bacterium]|jgi:membrane-associated phospholipid phosphatase